jgi:tetratricopeptide (TPR) repeat protein
MIAKKLYINRVLVAVILTLFSHTACSVAITDTSLLIGKKWWGGPPVTVTEYKALEPLCKLVMVNYFFKHPFWYDMNRPDPIFQMPEYRMGYKADWLHHYCDAQINRFRFIVSDRKSPRSSYMDSWIGELQYSIEAATETKHPYLYRLLTELAEAYYFTHDYSTAIRFSLDAIKANDKNPKAHRMLAESYMKAGKKNEALQAVNVGLKSCPDSKILKNLLSDLTATPANASTDPAPGPIK